MIQPLKWTGMIRMTSRILTIGHFGIDVLSLALFRFPLGLCEPALPCPRSWTDAFAHRVLYSTSYMSGLPGMMADFNVQSEPLATLGITTYLFGLAVGTVVLAPLSEMYGRRPVYLISMTLFMLLVLPCALATSLSEILVVRFIG